MSYVKWTKSDRGMNFFGKVDVRDNLIKVKDIQAASELLEISFTRSIIETEF